MTENIRKKLSTTAVALIVSFCVFSLLLYYSFQKSNVTISTNATTIIFLLILLHFLSVFAIFSHLIFKQRKQFILWKKDLTEQKNTNISLQNQLEENIEKRIYELQVVNGALNREIGERIQAEQEVRELQKQLTLILNSAGEGILGLDNSGRVVFLNSAASLMLGWEPDEIIGQEHHELIHHTFADGQPHPVDQCPIYKAYKDGLVHYRTGDVFWCKNGTSFPVEYSSTPINDQGMLTGAVVVFRDMSTFC